MLKTFATCLLGMVLMTTVQAEPQAQPGGYFNIDNDDLVRLVDEGVVLIDIRREEEWRETGVVEQSKTLTLFDATGGVNPDFVPTLSEWVSPDQPVALICRTGNRTQVAALALVQQLGFDTVYNVTHGITGWIAEKRDVVAY
ncbi:MAG: rhodanese-like domain-containing protein [Gammaproteobacteria bacterium]|nr:rhodanese-like domain-containing protein [Gammaproteobacteria bacterium]